jgi:hypothetical protein
MPPYSWSRSYAGGSSGKGVLHRLQVLASNPFLAPQLGHFFSSRTGIVSIQQTIMMPNISATYTAVDTEIFSRIRRRSNLYRLYLKF